MTSELAWAIPALSALAAVFALVAAWSVRRSARVAGEMQRLEGEVQNLHGAMLDAFSRAREAEEGRARHQREERGRAIREGFAQADENARHLREEVSRLVTALGSGLRENFEQLVVVQRERLDGAIGSVNAFAERNERRFEEMRGEALQGREALRDEIGHRLTEFRAFLGGQLSHNAESQRERLDGVAAAIREHSRQAGEAQDKLRDTVQGRLDHLRQENAQKLDEMRATVDEKLQGTLEQRLGESFRRVDEQLKQVHESVGKMQDLATGVGDLKRVLGNVKMRGGWAEVSLGSLLEEAFTPEQFSRNVAVKPDSEERVEFAVKLPGQGDGERPCWLPIDAKFPIEDYQRYMEASERGDVAATEAALKALEGRIRREAATICRKYVAPPHTTDFGILFLPTEGLYAEVIRRPGLIEDLQRECHIVVAGPTVLMAILSSLRMGFRTLAIQQKSSEVWKLLSAVKAEFGNYGAVLDKVKKKLDEASNTIEVDVRRRSRAIDRKLREVELLPEHEAVTLLALPNGANGAALLEDLAE